MKISKKLLQVQKDPAVMFKRMIELMAKDSKYAILDDNRSTQVLVIPCVLDLSSSCDILFSLGEWHLNVMLVDYETNKLAKLGQIVLLRKIDEPFQIAGLLASEISNLFQQYKKCNNI